ncbi:MAG: aldo/keto reductase [Puniceicoccaceae bacterium]
MEFPTPQPDTNPIGLGCWALGGKGWGGQSEKDAMEVMASAFDHGIRHFDTARIYGVSEELVGRFLEDRRSGIFLASKVYPRGDGAYVRAELEQSLKRLRTDFIDLYYLHWPVDGWDITEQMAALVEAKAEGLIGSIGVSNYSVGQLQQALKIGAVDYLQTGYHLFWRQAEESVIPFCLEKGIRVVSYSSLGQGILTGKFPKEPAFPKGDHRADRVIHFHPDVWPHVYRAVEKLQALAQSVDQPLAHLALQWCAGQAGIDTVLVGARNRKQMLENASALEDTVEPAVLQAMTAISDAVLPLLPPGKHIFDL